MVKWLTIKFSCIKGEIGGGSGKYIIIMRNSVFHFGVRELELAHGESGRFPRIKQILDCEGTSSLSALAG